MVVVATIYPASPVHSITITEIMYHPLAADESSLGGKSLEWVEIYNDEPTVFNLSGSHFSNGISFTFPHDTYLEGRSYLVVCADEQAVRDKYDITNTIGNFLMKLDNGGEVIEWSIFGGGPMVRVKYSDRNQWPHAADGTGHSLALKDVYLDPDDNDNWVASQDLGGTPGRPNFGNVSVFETVIIENDEVWRYLKGTVPFPVDWMELSFVDTAWLSGPTGIGYDDGDDRTVLADMPFIEGVQNGYWSFAARKTFTLTQTEIDSFDSIDLDLVFDDGFVGYLNGEEFARGNMGTSGTPVSFSQPAALNDDPSTGVFPIDKSLLQAGLNVLAVEIHNGSLTSSDASFIPRLMAQGTLISTESEEPVFVVINECLARTSGERWIELYNKSTSSVDISGFHLSSDRNVLGMYTIPPGSVIPGNGILTFTEFETGLSFIGLELTFYFTRPDLSEVIDAQLFERAPLDDVSHARFPDGRGRFFYSTTPTFDALNQVPLNRDLVIHEIMYHPPWTLPGIEFIELYNKGSQEINLSGYEFNRGITFTFPEDSLIPAKGYLVVAADPPTLQANHGISGVYGPYEGVLSDFGELVRVVDTLGNIVDEVEYADSGRWSRWPDGGGSSLELMDAEQDNSVASAWAASDESGKSDWEVVEYTTSYLQQDESEFQIRMLGAAEVLIDSIELTLSGSTIQLILNGDFESDTDGWRIDGNHIQSHRTTEDSFEGNACLKIVATGDGEPRANRIERDTWRTLAGGTYHVKLALRWLRGSNLIYFSGFTQSPEFQHTHWMNYPVHLGTPGAPNSQAVANLGPVISDVSHEPVVPLPNEVVQVFARVSDSDGLLSVSAKYRINTPIGAFSTVSLSDDGLHEDGDAGDGLFGGTIPGQGFRSKVVYYIEARDTSFEVRTFPVEAPLRTLIYQHDNPLTAGGFTARVIHDDPTWAELTSRLLHSNELVNASFVFNELRNHYNVGTRFRGSPWGRPPRPRAYRVKFGRDDLFRGRKSVNISRFGNTQNDRAAQYAVWRNSTFSTPSPLYRSSFAIVKSSNGIVNAGILNAELMQPVNKEFLKLWFPQDHDGNLMKITARLVFTDAGDIRSDLRRWASYDYMGNDKANYRWYWNPRTHEEHDDFDPLIELLEKMSTTEKIDNELPDIMDMEQFLRVYAARCAHAEADTLGISNGHNAYAYYAPIEGRWKLITWDMNQTWNNANNPVYPDNGRFGLVISRPRYRRIYHGIFNEMLNGLGGKPGFWQSSEIVSKFLDRNTAVVGLDGVANADGIRNFIDARRSILLNEIPGPVSFSISTNNGQDFSVNSLTTQVTGQGWVDVHTVLVSEEIADMTWSTSTWETTVELNGGPNDLTFSAFDSEGNLVGSDSIGVESTFGWPAPTIETMNSSTGRPGDTIMVSGVEFHDGILLFFGNLQVDTVVFDESVNPLSLSVEVPSLKPGVYEVNVQNTDGRSSPPFDFEVLPPLPPDPLFIRGDANSDSQTNISDVITILGHKFQGRPTILLCGSSADVNDSGSVNIADAVFLLGFKFLGGRPPPDPHGSCGLDPTPEDSLSCNTYSACP